MGCGSSVLIPELGKPRTKLAPFRVAAVKHESGCQDVDIAYRVFREELKAAGVVVWQHAYGDTGESVWAGCKVDIFEKYCVVVPDALGHGTQSSKPTDPEYYTPKTLADGILAILNQEDIRKAHYVGYSMGGYIGCCLLAHCPERWSTMAIGGWNPEGLMPGFVAGLLANTYTQPWMDPKRDKAALKQASYACCNPVPNLEANLSQCGSSGSSYPRLLLWAGESDMVFRGIQSCSRTRGFPLIAVPGSHEHINKYTAGIPTIRSELLRFVEQENMR